jgi:multiple sugar transport system substrate-binding protein
LRSQRRVRIARWGAGCAVLAVGLTGCVSAKNTAANPTANQSATNVTLTISANDIVGGKNAAEANWITNTVIPGFVAMEKTKGVNATVNFEGAGVADEQYKTKLELNLKTGAGGDVVAADGIWLGALASANYVKPLKDLVGDRAAAWDGWSQIPKNVQQNMTYQGQLYGIPNGTDGRVLYFNKTLFSQAGLPANWQPTSWQDVLTAGQALKKLPGVTPIQLNAGTPMGEATTTQGFLPLLAGTGTPLFDQTSKKWQGATPAVVDVLTMYQKIYAGSALGDAKLQQDQAGRTISFTEFSQGKIGILLEGDYLWRSIICPDKASCNATSMPDRNAVVGFAKIPAMQPGKGSNGQDFVSVSGGSGWLINPATKFPQQAFDLVAYMQSAEMQTALSKAQVRISARNDVNQATLNGDPLLTFISQQVLPITTYRPSDAHYSAVSTAIQQATADVVSGQSPQEAAQKYQASMEKVLGGPDQVQAG